MDIKIVVLERGWVVVGHYREEGEEVVLTSGAVIQQWGTTKGLPELISGPTKSTILNKATKPIRFLKTNTILMIDVEDSKWLKILS